MSKRAAYIPDEANWIEQLIARPGVLGAGLFLLLLATILLVWNEYRAMVSTSTLDHGAIVVYEADPDQPDPAANGRLVHVIGKLSSDEELVDTEFGISAKAIQLVRKVEMFQWEEFERTEIVNRSGGVQERLKTYDYSMVWRNHVIDSSRFHVSYRHRNKNQFPFASKHIYAKKVQLGAYTLPLGMIREFDNLEPIKLDQKTPLPDYLTGYPHISRGVLYVGARPNKPTLGDIRVTFLAAQPTTVSIVAAQTGTTFAEFRHASDDPVAIIATGAFSAEALYPKAYTNLPKGIWPLRLSGLGLLLGGFWLLMGRVVEVGGKPRVIDTLCHWDVYASTAALTLGVSGTLIGLVWIGIRSVPGSVLLLAGLGLLAALWSIPPPEWLRNQDVAVNLGRR